MGKKPTGRPQVTEIRISAKASEVEPIVRTIHQYIRKADRHGVVNVYVDGNKAEGTEEPDDDSLLQ